VRPVVSGDNDAGFRHRMDLFLLPLPVGEGWGEGLKASPTPLTVICL